MSLWTAGSVHVGAAQFWLGVTVPADVTALALTSNEPATGTHMGITEGDAVVTINQSKLEIASENHLAPVDVVVTEERMTIAFKAKEALITQIVKYLTGQNYVSQSSKDVLRIGGNSTATKTSCVLVAPQRGQTNKNIVAMIYSAYPSGDLNWMFARGSQQIFDVQFTGLAITTRTVGDQVGQLWRDQ